MDEEELEEKEEGIVCSTTSGVAQTLPNRYKNVEDLALPRELRLCKQVM